MADKRTFRAPPNSVLERTAGSLSPAGAAHHGRPARPRVQGIFTAFQSIARPMRFTAGRNQIGLTER
jgi:hypothetical protein